MCKNGFPGGARVSGGIDSAVVCGHGVDALGADKVHSDHDAFRYTSEESIKDAADCASALGIRYDTVPIAEPVEGFTKAWDRSFPGTAPDTTEENLQARSRGVILMAISNKFGYMVVTTGNKSEMSVGYATLYGDMNGGYNPIKDLYKTQVYGLWRHGVTRTVPIACWGLKARSCRTTSSPRFPPRSFGKTRRTRIPCLRMISAR
jgi:NAD+ synthase